MTEYNVIELAKYDRKLFEIAESIKTATGIQESELKIKYIIAAVGKENAVEIIDGKGISDADLMKVDVAFLEIKAEYDEKVTDVRNRLNAEQFELVSQLGDAVAGLSNISSVLQSVENSGNHNGFRVLK